MTNIENAFICIAAPLMIAAVCMGKKYLRFFLFFLAGMGACMFSAYFNTFFSAIYDANVFSATADIAPVVEESIKLLPLLFYLFVFEPDSDEIHAAVLTIAAGFATFENICYLIQNGAEKPVTSILRPECNKICTKVQNSRKIGSGLPTFCSFCSFFRAKIPLKRLYSFWMSLSIVIY